MTDRLTALLDGGGPVLADGAMGTMLFAAGLQFGDPPEIWNLSHPDVVRASTAATRRGRADPAHQYVRRQSLPTRASTVHEDRVDELNRTAAILLRAEVDAAGGTALVAGDIGPSGLIMSPLGTLELDDAVDGFAEQAARSPPVASTSSGSRRCPTSTRSARPRGRPGVAPDDPHHRDHDLRHPRPHDDGRLARAGGCGLAELGVDAFGGNCGNGPDELSPVIAQDARGAPGRALVAKSNVGMPQLVDMTRRLPATPPMMAGCALEMRTAGRPSSAPVAAARRSTFAPWQRRSGAPDPPRLTGRASASPTRDRLLAGSSRVRPGSVEQVLHEDRVGQRSDPAWHGARWRRPRPLHWRSRRPRRCRPSTTLMPTPRLRPRA